MKTTIYQRISGGLKRLFGPWFVLDRTPEGYWRDPDEVGVTSREVALTIPPVSRAMDLYKNLTASLPIIVYERVQEGKMKGRRPVTTIPEAKLLSTKPNPLMTRPTFVKLAVDDYWWEGEAFLIASYNGAGGIVDIHRIPASQVHRVEQDQESGEKVYTASDGTGTRTFPQANERVIHIIRDPDDTGLRGVPLLVKAGEVLGLHRQIIVSAKAFYKNSVRPSGYIQLTDGKPNAEAVENIRRNFKDAFAGAAKTGEIPALANAKFETIDSMSAADAMILEAMQQCTATVAQIFGLVPSDLGDQSQSKYASVSADIADRVSRSIRPILDTFETALNAELFPDGRYWAEFDVDEILRGDPLTFATVVGMGLTAGYLCRDEVRDWWGLEPREGMEQALAPLNQGAAMNPPTTPNQQPPAKGPDANDPAPPLNQ